jgi:hypothetical protein
MHNTTQNIQQVPAALRRLDGRIVPLSVNNLPVDILLLGIIISLLISIILIIG